jgi:hypothetical protein
MDNEIKELHDLEFSLILFFKLNNYGGVREMKV